MRSRLLGARRFTLGDQNRFARLSGDFNPLHLDPVVARRELPGQTVVHGVHVVSWALETYLATRPARSTARISSVSALSATFSKPVFLQEPVRAELVEETGESVRLQVGTGGVALVELLARTQRGGGPRADAGAAPGAYLRSRAPHERSAGDLPGLSDVMTLRGGAGALRRAFPASARAVGTGALRGLLGLSRLVGMECPGRYSLLASFDLDSLTEAPSPRLAYRVERFDPRFSALRIEVTGAGLHGTLNAFLLPRPADQPDLHTVAERISRGEFAGQRALVVGGSRGLGEVLAKLLAAGGGHPALTYRTGRQDAERVVNEIRAGGGRCDLVQLDVIHPDAPLDALAREGWTPSHLYYLATPKIFVRRTRIFDDRLFRTFLAVYVQGFRRTFEACLRRARVPLRVFYPSSVAVSEPAAELAEYAAAKAAGEALARHLERTGRDTRVLVERLPRLRTDQTTTLLKTAAADPLDAMREVARKLHAL